MSRQKAPRAILGAAMVVSVVSTLYLGRGTTFTGDEMVLLVTSPGLDFDTALQPHGGHLLLIPRLVYAPLLEAFGLSYVPYRVLTVLSVCLAVGLLFTWLIRRIPAYVALVPCLVLLFFGSDHLHMLQGNGFIICFSLAMGLLAMLMLEREDSKGDLIACVALVVAATTYSVGLPFIVGAGVSLMLARRRKSLWVPIIPGLLYFAWYVWVRQTEFSGPSNEAELSNLLDLPGWGFQAAGAALYGLSGLSFNSSEGMSLDLIDLRATLIAALLILTVVWSTLKGRSGRGLLVALSIGLTLWSLQVLVSGSGGRLPDDARYLYPGAVACVLILAEAVRGVEWRSGATVALYLIGAIGLFTNISLLANNGDFYRERGEFLRGNVGIASLAIEARSDSEIGGEGTPTADVDELVKIPGGGIIAMADQPYGEFGLTPEEIKELPYDARESLDEVLVRALQASLELTDAVEISGCRPLRSGESASLPPGGATVATRSGVEQVRISRFADPPGVPLGSLAPGEKAKLVVPADSADLLWKIEADGGKLRVCGAAAAHISP